MLPTLSRPPAPFSAWTDRRTFSELGRGGAGPGGGLALLCHLGRGLRGQGQPPRTPLARFFSGETATSPGTKGGLEDLSPPPEHPAPAFLVGYPFSLLCVCLGKGVSF